MEYLESNPGGHTPTEIGVALGLSYARASAAVNIPLKVLVVEGWAYRQGYDPSTKRRVLYGKTVRPKDRESGHE